MPTSRHWGFVGRPREMASIGAAIEDGPGAAILGPVGVGKSRLMAQHVSGYDTAKWHVVPVAATAALASIPFGPLASLLDDRPIGDRLEALHRIRTQVGSDANGRSVLVAVDDLHLLDTGSLGFIEWLLSSGSARVIATIRTDDDRYSAVRPLLKGDLMTQTWVGDLDIDQTRQMVASVVGADPTPDLLRRVWVSSNGNPLFIRELMLGALRSGTIESDRGVVALRGSLGPSLLLRDLIRERLGHIDSESRDTLAFLSLVEPLPRGVVAEIASHQSLEVLLSRALVTQTGADLRCSHPLVGEVTRGVAEPRALARILDAYRVAIADPSPAQALHLATAMAELEEPVPVEIGVLAATEALRLLDAPLATRILQRVPAEERRGDVALLEATALSLSGRLSEAIQLLDSLIDRGGTDIAVATAAVRRARIDYHTRDRPSEAIELLDKVHARMEDPAARAELLATRTMAMAVLGQFDRIVELGRHLLDTGNLGPAGLVSASVALSLAQTLTGDLGDVDQVIEDGIIAARSVPAEIPFGAEQLRFNRVLARQAEGELAMAHEIVDGAIDIASSREVATEWLYQASHTASIDGSHPDAGVRLTNAIDRLLSADPFSSGPMAICHLALHHLGGGDLDSARAIFDRVTEFPRTGQGRHLTWIQRTSLWIAIRQGAGDPDGFIDIGDATVEAGHHVWAAFAYHDAARCGRFAPAADRLQRLSAENRGGLIAMLADFAQAAAAGDVDELFRIATLARHRGAKALTTDAYACIARARIGSPEGRRAALRAIRCRRTLPNYWSPITETIEPPLTPRQTHVAELAARGLSSPAIADELYISTRTVNNHLLRVYRALDISDRSDLESVLFPFE